MRSTNPMSNTASTNTCPGRLSRRSTKNVVERVFNALEALSVDAGETNYGRSECPIGIDTPMFLQHMKVRQFPH